MVLLNKFPVILTALTLLCLSPSSRADEDEWRFFDLEEQALAVSEGELAFLTEPPAQPVHRHENAITITEQSLRTGWVGLSQCHYHLDAVERAEVVFAEGRMRGLKLGQTQGIARAWVEGSSVQLQKVEKGATLCLAGESRALSAQGEGGYLLRNGPYMRRFLDGYYPMQVRMRVDWGTTGLVWEGVSPQPQPGFELRRQASSVLIETSFSGRLVTEISFRRR